MITSIVAGFLDVLACSGRLLLDAVLGTFSKAELYLRTPQPADIAGRYIECRRADRCAVQVRQIHRQFGVLSIDVPNQASRQFIGTLNGQPQGS